MTLQDLEGSLEVITEEIVKKEAALNFLREVEGEIKNRIRSIVNR